MMKKIFYLVLLMISVPLISYSQQYFQKADLVADLDILYKTIRETHPNMYANISQEEFEKRFNEAKASFADSMTKAGFFKIAAPLVSAIGDGHTELFIPTKTISSLRLHNIPVEMRVEAATGSLLTGFDISGQIPDGSKILSINNMSADEIIETMLTFISGEGRSYRLRKVNNNFKTLFKLIDSSPLYTVEYEWEGTKHKKDIKAERLLEPKIKQAAAERLMKKYDEKVNVVSNKPKHSGPYYHYIIDSLSTCVVAYNTFDPNSLDFNDLEESIEKMFEEIENKNIENLIIDIRQNPGGDTGVGSALLKCFSKVPFAQVGYMKTRVSDEYLKMYPWDKREKGIYEVKESDIKLIQPNKKFSNIIKGDIYLLQSLRTFSASAKFAWAFHYFKMGTIVGEETGGYVVSFGQGIPLKLPNIDLDYRCSCKEFRNYGATEEDMHGVIPDINVPSDKALDKALELISHKYTVH